MKLKNAINFRNMISAVAVLYDEITFLATTDGIKARTMDSSHIAMVDFELPKEAFEEFSCNEETKIRIDVGKFLKLLKRVHSKDKVEILFSPTITKGQLQLKIVRGSSSREFMMPTLEMPEEEEVPIPKLTFDCEVKMVSSVLQSCLEDADLVGDTVRFVVDKEKLILDVRGELMSANIVLDRGTLLNLEAKEPSRATFNLSYLVDIVKKASVVSDVVTLEFATDMPIKMDFSTADTKLAYYCAPRIETD